MAHPDDPSPRQRHPQGGGKAERPPGGGGPAAAPEGTRELLSAVRALPEKYSAVIHLYYYEGYSIKEIANCWAPPAPTVGTRLARGRERLRQMLKEED